MTDINVLEELEKLKSSFKCVQCKEFHFVLYRVKLCSHILCSLCVSYKCCPLCNTIFTSEDIYMDHTSITTIKSLEIIADELKKCNDTSKTISVSTVTVHVSEDIDDNDINTVNFTDQDFECDCYQFNILETADKVVEKETDVENVDKRNAVGETKLHRACKKHNQAEVLELLSAGADVNAQDYAGWTPLHEAVIIGDEKIVKWLLKWGSVVNAPGDRYDTPLHKAVAHKHESIIKILLENGANIHSKNYFGESPWDFADSDTKFILTSVQHNIKLSNRFISTLDNKRQWNIFILGKIKDDLSVVLKDFVDRFKINIVKDFNKHVTHVVTNNASKIVKPSYELLIAILKCVPVITIEWLCVCNNMSKIMSYNDYLIIGTKDYPNNIINVSQVNKQKLIPKLFSNCNFFIAKQANSFNLNGIQLDRNKFVELLTSGNGKLLKREPHLPTVSENKCFPWHSRKGSSIEQCCHYILYDPKINIELRYNMKELRHIQYQWIYECILQYKLVPPELMHCRN